MTRTKSQNGRRSRAKGAAFERWVVSELRRVGLPAERNIAQVRTAAREGCDVEGTEWWIECKVGAAPNPFTAYVQAESDRPDHDARPILVAWKRDRHEPMVTAQIHDLAHASAHGKAPEAYRGGEMVTMTFGVWLRMVTP